MKTFKLKVYAGDQIGFVAKQAKAFAIENSLTVEFVFNGIACLVSGATNTDFLLRDYDNAFTMGWKAIGPDCAEQYAPEVEADLKQRKEAAERKAESDRIEWVKRDADQRSAVASMLSGIDFTVEDEPGYDSWKANNTDGYGAAIFEYAETWARLMQERMSRGHSIVDCASPTSFELGYLGITGYQYGAAVAILSKHWKYGETLRRWHNKEYGKEIDGVVNPALLTIS